VAVRVRIEDPVEPKIMTELFAKFMDFRRACTEDLLSVNEFDSFGPTRRTLRQFIAACSGLDEVVRDVMIPE
jgi:transaldolase